MSGTHRTEVCDDEVRDDEVRMVAVPVATVWTTPDAPRDVDCPALWDQPDVPRWTAALDEATRKGLHGRTVTQLLLGERVEVVEERGGWARIHALGQPSAQAARGYPGWVRSAHLAQPVPETSGPTVVVVGEDALCVLDTGAELRLSFGTRLRAESPERGVVLLPGGRRGCIDPEQLRRVEALTTYRPDDVLATARRFLGLRYVWGGTSAWGVDCSGLVHLAHRAHGVVLPRDASDQAAAVEPVPLDQVRPGDLYFFAHPGRPVFHVGFVTRPVDADGVRWMLHAPESGELVEDAPLHAGRHDTLVAAGRVRALPDAGLQA
jgi:hypothetical protein